MGTEMGAEMGVWMSDTKGEKANPDPEPVAAVEFRRNGMDTHSRAPITSKLFWRRRFCAGQMSFGGGCEDGTASIDASERDPDPEAGLNLKPLLLLLLLLSWRSCWVCVQVLVAAWLLSDRLTVGVLLLLVLNGLRRRTSDPAEAGGVLKGAGDCVVSTVPTLVVEIADFCGSGDGMMICRLGSGMDFRGCK